KKELQSNKVNPRDLKRDLAVAIVKMYHSEAKANKAAEEFDKIFKKKELPSRIPKIQLKEKSLNILDLLVKTKQVSSKSEAKRLVMQNGVKIGGVVQNDWRREIELKKDLVIQIGKRKFVKLN
ncbi:MAG: tyrosine--tRNA ligase, partial [Candidatus Pacebacteria bacterium]|nr:tyrosine--tRNA ligase [Candidatus Paceibacterota bacterium]